MRGDYWIRIIIRSDSGAFSTATVEIILNDFSAFFRESTKEERTRVLEDIVKKANQDQKDLVEQYRKIHRSPTL